MADRDLMSATSDFLTAIDEVQRVSKLMEDMKLFAYLLIFGVYVIIFMLFVLAFRPRCCNLIRPQPPFHNDIRNRGGRGAAGISQLNKSMEEGGSLNLNDDGGGQLEDCERIGSIHSVTQANSPERMTKASLVSTPAPIFKRNSCSNLMFELVSEATVPQSALNNFKQAALDNMSSNSSRARRVSAQPSGAQSAGTNTPVNKASVSNMGGALNNGTGTQPATRQAYVYRREPVPNTKTLMNIKPSSVSLVGRSTDISWQND